MLTTSDERGTKQAQDLAKNATAPAVPRGRARSRVCFFQPSPPANHGHLRDKQLHSTAWPARSDFTAASVRQSRCRMVSCDTIAYNARCCSHPTPYDGRHLGLHHSKRPLIRSSHHQRTWSWLSLRLQHESRRAILFMSHTSRFVSKHEFVCERLPYIGICRPGIQGHRPSAPALMQTANRPPWRPEG